MQTTVFASIEPAPWLGLPRSPGPAERSIASGYWPDWPSLGSSLPTRLASTTVLHSCPFTHRVHASRSSKPLSAELIDCCAVAVSRGRTAHFVSGRQTPYFYICGKIQRLLNYCIYSFDDTMHRLSWRYNYDSPLNAVFEISMYLYRATITYHTVWRGVYVGAGQLKKLEMLSVGRNIGQLNKKKS